MAQITSTTKRALITKASSTMVIATAIAAFLIVFCAVSSKALITQAFYQDRVISARKQALATIKSDLTARDSLVAAYSSFEGMPQNILGGSSTGAGSNAGDNAQIILDALPSSYDMPAVLTSVEKLATNAGLTINSINAVDNELTQGSVQTSSTPTPVTMPFEVELEGSYAQIQAFVSSLEASIRPFQVQTVQLAADSGSVTATIDAQTFYQPAKNLNITDEVVK
jgi:hypothetical protein